MSKGAKRLSGLDAPAGSARCGYHTENGERFFVPACMGGAARGPDYCTCPKDPMGYNQICAAIDAAPRTYLGGIMAHAVRACVRKNFFQSNDALMLFLGKTIDDCESPNAQSSATAGAAGANPDEKR